jgi:hypothetical protein
MEDIAESNPQEGIVYIVRDADTGELYNDPNNLDKKNGHVKLANKL